MVRQLHDGEGEMPSVVKKQKRISNDSYEDARGCFSNACYVSAVVRYELNG